ncbi:Hsp20/alpha crystallin family protein [uncultured Porphyromonas sp.]|uniref:Hsp20/alpha crystallin family protein n=1 Tax=uncultured Porphyromonas sp. TaxID=159274 RepID=UPI00259B53F9|nr:Hsp20/alpha crystallin family protein [uncultured Porphyromonas sp.]
MGRTIFDLMDEIFANDMVRPAVASNRRSTTPMCNVMESDKEYTIQIAAPGLTKEDVQVKLDEDEALVISMQKKEEQNEVNSAEASESEHKEVSRVEESPVRYLRREFMHQSFVQRLLLPEDVDKEGISAKMENGMLEVVIPKLKEEEKTPIERVINIG